MTTTNRPSNLQRTQIDPRIPEVASAGTGPTPLKLAPGLRIEHYELIRELGRGGMGQVFLARDTRLGRRVAMKFLVSSSPKFTERFVVEAKVTAAAHHENIVVIHDVGKYSNLPYMVLEYVEGTPLSRVMEGKRLPIGRAIELIVPVVKALVRAHEANIVHRDLKPDNIIVNQSGTVKVLDFGIAKLFADGAPAQADAVRPGGVVGTLPYMSPEQLGTDEVDHRSDLWAVGIIMYEMLAGRHPLEPLTQGVIFGAAASEDPMPSLADNVAGLPDRVVQIVDRCLRKKKTERYGSAAELLAELEPLLPSRTGRHLVADESPYPGLNAFQESDADRFFGRSQDIAGAVAKLRDQPIVAVIGPSGAGKSSFVRAGVVPALKAGGDAWEVIIVRPGRQPLAALATALENLRDSKDSGPQPAGDPIARLRAEPGFLGTQLRARARKRRSQIVLFVDQHEELYTLVPDPAERRAFTACLIGAADDTSGPLRVVVAMRSDFLDRAAEDRYFVEELARGLVFLQPPNRAGLEAALAGPLETLGYAFEPGIVASMLETLEATPGPLPLLQFTAAKLWEQRDRQRRVLTRDAYERMGGVAGALATHADEVVGTLSADDQKLVKVVFQRLVTPERTRAIVDQAELRELGGDVDRILGLLVTSRLVVVHSTAVELVHESLIKDWPTLRRWLDENQEDAIFLAQLRAAAQQWDQRQRVEGLLWRNEAMEEARLWRSRSQKQLPAREQAFLDAVFELANRAQRARRRIVVGAFGFLCVLVAAAAVALIMIRNAEQRANERAAENARLLVESTNANAAAEVAHKSEQKAWTEREAALKEKLEQEQKINVLEKTADTAVRQQAEAVVAAKTASMAAQSAAKDAQLAKAALEAEQKRKADAQKKKDAQRGTVGSGILR